MTTYYVRVSSGSDLNNGLTPATAWRTIGKALGASGISSGDTVYVGAGVYREVVTIGMTSPTGETTIYGDRLGEFTGDAGEVQMTAYTTNDKTAPTANAVLTLSGRDWLTFRNFVYVGSSASMIVNATAQSSTHITFDNCVFLQGGTAQAQALNVLSTNGVALDWLVQNCVFLAGSTYVINITADRSASADYDLNFVIRNCLSWGGRSAVAYINVDSVGAGDFYGGGVDAINCSHIGGTNFIEVASNFLSTSIPCTVYNCFVICSPQYAVWASVLGQIVEDYNLFVTTTPRLNVNTGSNSVSDGSYAPLVELGQFWITGEYARPFGMPRANSPLLGFGDNGSAPATDITGRPRPAGGQSTLKAVGAYERHDTGIEDTSVYDSAPASLKIIGPGDHDFDLPVNPVATNITIMARYDTAHGATNKPQAQLLPNPKIGLTSGSTLTMTEVADTWEQLAFPTFVPTDYGVVTLRCLSRSSSGSGAAWFDSITV